MSWYILEPRQALTLPPGAPISFEPDADSLLGFPPPSELAALLRTAPLVPVRGPLLCSLEGGSPTPLFPTARDALTIASMRIRFKAGEFWEPPYTEGNEAPCRDKGARTAPRRRGPDFALDDGPAFWGARAMRSWLEDGHQEAAPLVVEEGLAAADRGALEESRFLFRKWRQTRVKRLGLMVRCEEPGLKPGLVLFGSERRLARLSPAAVDPTWPAPALRGDDARVVLLTPGVFDGEDGPVTIAGARVVGWFSSKARWGTGGDRAGEGAPRRRSILGAGSVFCVSLDGQDPAEWAAKVHFQEISSRAEDRRDGFGLAVVGR